MKLIGQIFAGALLGFLSIAALCIGAWNVWLRPAVMRFSNEQAKQIQTQEIEKARNENTNSGEEIYWATWRDSNDTATEPASEKPHPYMIVGLNKEAGMLLFGPYPSQAKAQQNISRFRDKYPDYYLIVAPIKP